MRITQFSKVIIVILLSVVITQLSGCTMLGYYGQSIKGQLSILYHRVSIDEVINDPNEDTALKTKLQRVKQIRSYASQQLLLPKNKSYLYYSDLKRPYVVWNVFAAPEFSLEPVTWCYPIVGCVSYRGYFKEDSAVDYAADLNKNGSDIYVAGIAAYSTLGWFDDPLLSSMVHWQDRSLAGLIFHELTHQIRYIPDETSFNEAFASAVERIGSIQWLMENDPSKVNHYVNFLRAQNDFRIILHDTREKLKLLYKQKITIEDMRLEKESIIADLRLIYQSKKKEWPANIHFDSWFKKPVNNARFTASMTYLQQIPAFYSIFIETKGDWAEFYKTILLIAEYDSVKRKALINAKLADKFALDEVLVILNKNLNNTNFKMQ